MQLVFQITLVFKSLFKFFSSPVLAEVGLECLLILFVNIYPYLWVYLELCPFSDLRRGGAVLLSYKWFTKVNFSFVTCDVLGTTKETA